MNEFMRKKMNKLGFSLIELIVVIAILAIIAAIGIPRFAVIRAKSEVRSDGAEASEIVLAARLWAEDHDADATAADAGSLNVATLVTEGYLTTGTADVNAPQSEGTFTLGYIVADNLYYAYWTPNNGYEGNGAIKVQGVIENEKFIIDEYVAP